MTRNKVPQNIQSLIGEIGERLALFKLYELTHEKPYLKIFKNYSESGYDIGVLNTKNGKEIKIEVKTRQHLITTTAEKSKNSCHFTLTANEEKHTDYVVCIWLEYNDFFIIPKKDLNRNKSGSKYVYKHIVSRLKKPKDEINLYSQDSMPYLGNWKAIINPLLK